MQCMADSGSTRLLVRNPRTGQSDYAFELDSPTRICETARALRAAQPRWRALGVEGRAKALDTFADALEQRRAAIIAALAADTGRWFLSETEVDGTIRNIRRWAKLAPEALGADMRGEERASALIPSVRYQNQYVPYPLAGFISPWNFPVTLSLIDAVPALAAGCAAI